MAPRKIDLKNDPSWKNMYMSMGAVRDLSSPWIFGNKSMLKKKKYAKH
jgi:hypothetical protein